MVELLALSPRREPIRRPRVDDADNERDTRRDVRSRRR
jgi:hypothetical protein